MKTKSIREQCVNGERKGTNVHEHTQKISTTLVQRSIPNNQEILEMEMEMEMEMEISRMIIIMLRTNLKGEQGISDKGMKGNKMGFPHKTACMIKELYS